MYLLCWYRILQGLYYHRHKHNPSVPRETKYGTGSGGETPFRSNVPKLEGTQQLLDHIIAGFEGIYKRHFALLESLVAPLEQYIANQNLVEHLAKKKEQVVQQDTVIRQQWAQILELNR